MATYFKKITVTVTAFNTAPDAVIGFFTQGIALLNESASASVQVSYDGVNVHDQLDPLLPSQGIIYDDKAVGQVWFRLTTAGSAVVSVRAWEPGYKE